jgi:hypothetical protein
MIPSHFFPTLIRLRQDGVDLNHEVDKFRIGSLVNPNATPKKEPLPWEDHLPGHVVAIGDEPSKEKVIVFNEGQVRALQQIREWLAGKEPYFALRGYAGTGKSTIMKEVAKENYNLYFSAPTNQATKVLSDFIGVQCKTTYSLLGLRMVAEEDQKILSMTNLPDLGANPILVIDEAGMLQRNLVNILIKAGYRCLFVGDPAQLNPIGEVRSKAWRIAGSNKALLTKVKRFDNQLLDLSIKLRSCLKDKIWKSPIKSNHSEDEGIFVRTRKEFERQICELPLEAWDETKLCCWRNRTVEGYNNIVREALGFKADYEVGERIMLASPLMVYGQLVAYTDEKFVVKSIGERVFSFQDYHIESYVLDVGREFQLNVPVDMSKYSSRASKLANYASSLTGSARKLAWRSYWEFVETFSPIRYGYGLTAHRLQGASCQSVYVDQSDILANPNKPEAFRALYVAATRPRKMLTTF